MNREQLARRLRTVLPSEAVVDEPRALRAWESDGLTAYRQVPLVVVLPSTEDQVRAVLRLCHREGVPVVPRGAGTGLSGGALPDAAGVTLALSRMQSILEIDADNRIARVQPGVRNLAVSEAVAHLGLFYAPDPSSQIACSIGGNVAENSGGVHCLKYGLTVHNVLGARVVLADGELLELGGATLDDAGIDLLALLTGSEGLLGVITEVTLRLLPKPAAVRGLLAAFDAVGNAGQAVAGIIGAGIIPAGLEMMDAPAIRAAEAFANAGYPTDAAALLICELDGGAAEIDALVEAVSSICRDHGATEVRSARDPDDIALLWKGRKSAFPAVGRIAPDYYCMDGTIPRARLADVLAEIERLSGEFGLGVANVFHAGDGNLHPLILYDANAAGELERAEAFGTAIARLCVDVGGTVTGEHGVGVEKLDGMCAQFSAAEIRQFEAVKAAFDPAGLLNPGKAIPTLARCAELGGMHVHDGQLSHPELPRF